MESEEPRKPRTRNTISPTTTLEGYVFEESSQEPVTFFSPIDDTEKPPEIVSEDVSMELERPHKPRSRNNIIPSIPEGYVFEEYHDTVTFFSPVDDTQKPMEVAAEVPLVTVIEKPPEIIELPSLVTERALVPFTSSNDVDYHAHLSDPEDASLKATGLSYGEQLTDDLINCFCDKVQEAVEHEKLEGFIAIQAVQLMPEVIPALITGEKRVLQILLDSYRKHYILLEWDPKLKKRGPVVYDSLAKNYRDLHSILTNSFKSQFRRLFEHLYKEESEYQNFPIPIKLQTYVDGQTDNWSCGLRAAALLAVRAFNGAESLHGGEIYINAWKFHPIFKQIVALDRKATKEDFKIDEWFNKLDHKYNFAFLNLKENEVVVEFQNSDHFEDTYVPNDENDDIDELTKSLGKQLKLKVIAPPTYAEMIQKNLGPPSIFDSNLGTLNGSYDKNAMDIVDTCPIGTPPTYDEIMQSYKPSEDMLGTTMNALNTLYEKNIMHTAGTYSAALRSDYSFKLDTTTIVEMEVEHGKDDDDDGNASVSSMTTKQGDNNNDDLKLSDVDDIGDIASLLD